MVGFRSRFISWSSPLSSYPLGLLHGAACSKGERTFLIAGSWAPSSAGFIGVAGVDETREQDLADLHGRHAVLFNVGRLPRVSTSLMRLQGFLPLNPPGLAPSPRTLP